MTATSIDIILSILVYVTILVISFFLIQRKEGDSNNGDDRDGGIILTEDPKIDLPPGVVFPSDEPSHRREIEEDVLF